MPVNINDLDLNRLETDPKQIEPYLASIENDLQADPKNFDLNYQWILKLRTLKNIHTIEQIDTKWIQMIEDLTELNHQLMRQNQPLPPLNHQIFNYLEPELNSIRNHLLIPIDAMDLLCQPPELLISKKSDLFWFSMNIFDDCAMADIEWDDLKKDRDLLNKKHLIGYALKGFIQHWNRINQWQNSMIRKVIKQYQSLKPDDDEQMTNILNRHWRWD